MLRVSLMLLMLLQILTILSSCNGRVKFNPNAYRASHELQAIVSASRDVVYCYDERFSEFACMHKDKWVELRRLIQALRMPKRYKRKVLSVVRRAEKQTESINFNYLDN